MMKYKIMVSSNDQNFSWILYDNGKFIRNPTEDDLEGAKFFKIND